MIRTAAGACAPAMSSSIMSTTTGGNNAVERAVGP
jgi:hypothetical protein